MSDRERARLTNDLRRLRTARWVMLAIWFGLLTAYGWTRAEPGGADDHTMTSRTLTLLWLAATAVLIILDVAGTRRRRALRRLAGS